jgi:ribosomal-protein-alanine N-acetyltransferase
MRLIPLTRELATALARGDFSALRGRNLADAEAHLREVAKAYGELYDRMSPSPPWIGYLAEDETSGIVGSCGYKGDCRDGLVEIAYFSFPGFEGRGFATEMARLLNDMAWSRREVRIICAHTLQEENASARILRRLGFTWVGTVDDPEDGLIWRWELNRP